MRSLAIALFLVLSYGAAAVAQTDPRSVLDRAYQGLQAPNQNQSGRDYQQRDQSYDSRSDAEQRAYDAGRRDAEREQAGRNQSSGLPSTKDVVAPLEGLIKR